MRWILPLMIAGCTAAPNVPPLDPLTRQLSSLDPDDGKPESVLVLGTDDDLFEGRIDPEMFYRACLLRWSFEIAPHIDGDFVVFLSHGGSIGGRWVCEYGPPYIYTVEYVVADIRRKLGPRNADTPIVLIVCNPWGYSVSDDATWYAEHNVFLIPDSAMDVGANDNRRNELPCGDVVVGWFDEFRTR